MKRLAALAAAVAMIAGAWAIRDAIDGDDGGSSGNDDPPATLRLTCATELAPMCSSMARQATGTEVTIEDPGDTADRLAELPAGEDPGFDAWLADGPWAAMVADDREFAGARGEVLGAPSEVLARSPAVIVVQDAQRGALEDACGGTITWRCIGDRASGLRVGLSAPARGDGLVALAEATASYFDTTDYSADQFDEPGFATWFDRLTQRSRTAKLGDRSAIDAGVGQLGTFNVVGALEAQSATLLRDREGWTTIYPEPMSIADVQLVPREGLDAGDLLDRLADRSGLIDAVMTAGWRPTQGQFDPVVGIPDEPGLPSPGTLNALRDRW